MTVAARTIVWAFEPLEELAGATGLVECDEVLAATLVAQQRAQDPRIGALLLRPIAPAGTYSTRMLEPVPAPRIAAPGVPEIVKRKRGRRRKTA
jgi:hypothetical protein